MDWGVMGEARARIFRQDDLLWWPLVIVLLLYKNFLKS